MSGAERISAPLHAGAPRNVVRYPADQIEQWARATQPEKVAATGGAYADISDRFADSIGVLYEAAEALAGVWKGATAKAALAQMQQMCLAAHQASYATGMVGSALQTTGTRTSRTSSGTSGREPGGRGRNGRLLRTAAEHGASGRVRAAEGRRRRPRKGGPAAARPAQRQHGHDLRQHPRKLRRHPPDTLGRESLTWRGWPLHERGAHEPEPGVPILGHLVTHERRRATGRLWRTPRRGPWIACRCYHGRSLISSRRIVAQRVRRSRLRR